MPNFVITTPVIEVYGHQSWLVEANDPDHALEVFAEGGCPILQQDVEVLSLGEPEVEGLYEPVNPGPSSEQGELEYLRFFYDNVDLGPAHEGVVEYINERFTARTGHPVPDGYEA